MKKKIGKKMEIRFIPVTDNQIKLRKVCETVGLHYRLGDSILITVESLDVARYVDLLLWKYPKDSFIPHQYSLKQVRSRVVITTKNENLNDAVVLLNLSPKIPSIWNKFQIIYDLDDQTSLEKKNLSDERRKAYDENFRKNSQTLEVKALSLA